MTPREERRPRADTAELEQLAEVVAATADTDALVEQPEVRRIVAAASPQRPFGALGPPLGRRSPFRFGFGAGLGAGLAALVLLAVLAARGVLILVAVALLLAIGLDPVVAWLGRRGMRRGLAVAVVMLALLGVAVGFVASGIPAVTHEGTQLARSAPGYLSDLQARSDWIGDVARRFGGLNLDRLSSHASLPGGLLGVGRRILGVVTATATVVVLTTYFLAALPQFERFAHGLVPRSRRARVWLLTDEILRRVSGYLLGNLLTSLIAGSAMAIFLAILGVPFALFLGLLVAVFDLVPMIGAIVAGAIVALVALTVSLPVALISVGFTAAFRLLEDYLLTPRIMRKTVEVPAVVTIVAVLIGGALLGIVGALLAIPVAAALDLIYAEVVVPRQDNA